VPDLKMDIQNLKVSFPENTVTNNCLFQVGFIITLLLNCEYLQNKMQQKNEQI